MVICMVFIDESSQEFHIVTIHHSTYILYIQELLVVPEVEQDLVEVGLAGQLILG